MKAAHIECLDIDFPLGSAAVEAGVMSNPSGWGGS